MDSSHAGLALHTCQSAVPEAPLASGLVKRTRLLATCVQISAVSSPAIGALAESQDLSESRCPAVHQVGMVAVPAHRLL